MNKLVTFTNDQFGEIRTVTIDTEPWFVAVDVCKALELNSNATRRLDGDEKITLRLTQGESNRTSDTVAVNEPGLYSLVLGSRKPEAKAFKRWITHDVIPAIRRTGGYIAGEERMNDDELIAQALLIVNRKLEERTVQLTEANGRIAKLEPKAAYYDRVSASKGLTNFRETAKLFGVKEKDLTKFVEDHKLCYRDSHNRLIAYAESRKNKFFELKECTYNGCSGEIKTAIYTKITPLGRQKIFEMMRREALV